AACEVLEDEGLFEEEEEEETGVLAMGDFADALGEDYLGLRELGIAAEFNMTSLSIPKKLLRGKKAQKSNNSSAKPTEPPPPYPPPPPFILLKGSRVEDQIGLLKSYYQSRFEQLALSQVTPSIPAPLPGPPGPSDLQQPIPYPPVPQPQPTKPPLESLILPDDPPNPVNAKMGPLGQIVRGGPAGATTKKKKTSGGGTGSGGGMGTEVGTPSPKKKKQGMVGVGTGNGRKKKTETGAAPMQNGTASQGQPMQPPSVQALRHGLPQGLPSASMPMPYLGPPPVAAYTLPMHMQMQVQPPVMGQ
ncbi:hypothetical protein H0H92_011606, partial [Tricholoma furcatifolium]